MNTSWVYFRFAGVLGASIVRQVVMLLYVQSDNRRGYQLPDSQWRNDAFINVGMGLALSAILECFSPGGPLAALSAPMFLLLPIVGVQSVLRMRRLFTLYGGLIASVLHLLLSIRAVLVMQMETSTYAFYLSYSCMLAMMYALLFPTSLDLVCMKPPTKPALATLLISSLSPFSGNLRWHAKLNKDHRRPTI